LLGKKGKKFVISQLIILGDNITDYETIY